MIGAGLALAIGALTEEALAGRSPIAIHGGWTIASRHAGVCIGLLVLTPIFTGDLTDQQHAAELAGTRIILDSKLGLSDKLDLGNALVEQIQSGPITRPPDLHPAFRKVGASAEAGRARGGDPGSGRSRRHARVQRQLSGGCAAGDGRGTAAGVGTGAAMTASMRLLLAAVVASVLLVGVYLAAGGRDYRPLATADPCRPRSWPDVHGTTQIAEQVAYSALDGAACKLGTSREELTLAFTSRDRLDEFARSHHLSTSQVNDAARDGLLRAIDDGERSGAINGVEAFVLRIAAQAAPVDRLIEYVRQGLG